MLTMRPVGRQAGMGLVCSRVYGCRIKVGMCSRDSTAAASVSGCVLGCVSGCVLCRNCLCMYGGNCRIKLVGIKLVGLLQGSQGAPGQSPGCGMAAALQPLFASRWFAHKVLGGVRVCVGVRRLAMRALHPRETGDVLPYTPR